MPDVTLKNVPGMADATAVPVLDAATLSEAVFQNDYVAQSRPCVIRGAVKHWPASRKWRDKEYLKARSGHHDIFLYENEYHVQARRMTAGKRELSFAEAIDRLHSDSTRLAIVTTALPTELLGDLGRFPFLTRAEPAYCYPPARYFFHRNAGTSPARTSDDLPLPEAPTTARKRLFVDTSAEEKRRSVSFVVKASRPTNKSASLSSKWFNPL